MAGVHAFSRQEVLGVDSEPVWVSELHLRERSASSWVVDDGSYDSLDESVSFRVVIDSERSRSDSVDAVGLVDALRVTLSLCCVNRFYP